MCRNLAGIRSGLKLFTTIKDILKQSWTRLDMPIFNRTILPAMLFTSKMWAAMKNEEHQLVMTQRAIEISLHEHIQSQVI